METTKQKQENELKYWFVEIVLTSSEILHFYVKALTEFDAYEKADYYSSLVSNDDLKNKLKFFKLMT